MENTKLKNIVEAILMSSDRILSLSQIEKMLTEKKTTTKEKPAQKVTEEADKESIQAPEEMAANDSEITADTTADTVTETAAAASDDETETEMETESANADVSTEVVQPNTLKASIKEVIAELQQDYAERATELKEVASGFRFQVRQEYADEVGKLWEERPSKYSRALLETLVLIAYRQPITRGEIESIRGVSVSSHIVKTLIEREWVRVIGHRDVPGKPAIYGSTKEFLDYFNLKTLDELPSLADIKDLDKVAPELALDEALPAIADSTGEETSSAETEPAEEAAVDPVATEIIDDDVDESDLNEETDSDEEVIRTEAEDSAEIVSDDTENVIESAEHTEDIIENNNEIEESDQSDSDDLAASQENEPDNAELS